jgi:hypothetical protein
MVSHHAAEHARGLNDPSIGNLVIEIRACDAPSIPFMRGGIFFYDLADQVLSSAIGDLLHASSPREWTNKFESTVLAAHVAILRDVASCHNSNRFLATPYAGGISSGILRRADG